MPDWIGQSSHSQLPSTFTLTQQHTMPGLCSHRKYIAMTMSAPTPTPVPLPDPRKVANKQRRKAGREVFTTHPFPLVPL